MSVHCARGEQQTREHSDSSVYPVTSPKSVGSWLSLRQSSNKQQYYMVERPQDILFEQQWYLDNRGQGNRTRGIDLNVLEVWEDYTGEGVAIAILDDGVERNHEDLRSNYDSNPSTLPGYSYTREGAPFSGQDNHGTSVAGIIAAERNRTGITGIAYNSRITAFSTNNISETDASPLARQQAFDISNNSWGIDNPFESNFEFEQNVAAGRALERATRRGRNGLGTVFVWAAGNEFEAGASSNYGGYESSRFTTTVAAIDGNGIVAPYSVQGSNLLVSAFGDGDPEFGIDGSIVTTDRTGTQGYNSGSSFFELDDPNYTGLFNGTSSATPMVSGIIALMIEANPRLGYRDVQEILAYSARQTERNDIDENGLPNWAFNGATNWNGGGLHTNINYGYGLVNARSAVRLAETWTTQHILANELQVQQESTDATPIRDNTVTTATVSVGAVNGSEVNEGNREGNETSAIAIDQVEVGLDLSHRSIEDLIITLISPTGTRSRLFNGPDLTEVFLDRGSESFTTFANNPGAFTNDDDLIALGESYRQGIDFTFSTTFHWGELSTGDWRLEIEDTVAGTSGVLNNWTLSLYGDRPSTNNTYFYTNDFAQMVRRDPASDRTRLRDTEGIDRINAAMVTRDLTLNLAPGRTNRIVGQSLIIDPETTIEQAIGGDGNDRIQGNDQDNQLFGGRGNDRLSGKQGSDRLEGQDGRDRLVGGPGRDRLLGQQDNDQLLGGSDQDRLLGGPGMDRLKGGNESDVLRGGPGDDWLYGQGGNDNQLFGNSGNDTFVLERGSGKSIIHDFQRGRDRIGLGLGLSFNQLNIRQDGNTTLISINNNLLATLRGNRLAQISQEDFIKT